MSTAQQAGSTLKTVAFGQAGIEINTSGILKHNAVAGAIPGGADRAFLQRV